ncbi:BnaA06g14870D [Brassica napus]|uniref:BnaA06g14870D protein n=1 Tax=Brassica napus TaxID=3708 RepID=A0A078GY12_BRANA|nr:BnaA06g14870D [Brassica napus]
MFTFDLIQADLATAETREVCSSSDDSSSSSPIKLSTIHRYQATTSTGMESTGMSPLSTGRFFGTNVMVTVATQQASNPVHTVANSLNLPGLELITKKLELPVKIVFRGVEPGVSASEFMMLGLGDMVALYVGGLYICGKIGWESVMKMGQDTRELSRMKRTV